MMTLWARLSSKQGFGFWLAACLVVLLVVAWASPGRSVHRPAAHAVSWHPAGILAWPEATGPARRTYYASPSGSPGNAGTVARPLDLATGLSARGPLRPGDVLWLREGVYRGNFRSDLAGTAEARIVVAQYPGERAVLDGVPSPVDPVLRVDGAHAVYWGFEVTSSAPNEAGHERGAGVDVFGPDTKFINLVIHHTGNGVGFWTPALASELYGCLIYQSGWDGPDRGHGHSVYVQNATPEKRLADNILLDGRSFGIHAYTERGQIDQLRIEGNISFDHGASSRVSGAKANILVGGWRVAQHTVLSSNYVYHRDDRAGPSVEIGHISGCSDAVMTDNYFAGSVPLALGWCDQVTMTGNTFVGNVSKSMASRFPENHYLPAKPTRSEIFIRPNQYQRGRANIAIFNWERRTTVRLDLSTVGLRTGEPFEIRDARNYFGEPLVRGVYARAPIDLPLTSMLLADETAPDPSGGVAEFGAVVVTPVRVGLAHGLPWASSRGDFQ
jgi:hypothetical protein